VTEALDVVVADLSDDVGEALAQADTLSEAIAVIVAPCATCSSSTFSHRAALWPLP
jgi:hypothetical protein